MIPDDKTGQIIWRLFERRKTASWIAEIIAEWREGQ